MIGTLGSQVGLLAFAMAIFAGIHAGNSPFTILTRALLIMVFAALVGQLAAGTARAVLREYLQSLKVTIDREHLESVKVNARESGEAPPQ